MIDTLQIDSAIVDTVSNTKTIYLTTKSTIANSIEIWKLVIQVVLGGLGLLATYFFLRKEIRSTKNLKILDDNLMKVNKINDLIGELLYEFKRDDYTRIYDQTYISSNHSKIETNLIAILDSNIQIERALCDSIQRYKTEEIDSIKIWEEEIITLKDLVIKNLKHYV